MRPLRSEKQNKQLTTTNTIITVKTREEQMGYESMINQEFGAITEDNVEPMWTVIRCDKGSETQQQKHNQKIQWMIWPGEQNRIGDTLEVKLRMLPPVTKESENNYLGQQEYPKKPT